MGEGREEEGGFIGTVPSGRWAACNRKLTKKSAAFDTYYETRQILGITGIFCKEKVNKDCTTSVALL